MLKSFNAVMPWWNHPSPHSQKITQLDMFLAFIWIVKHWILTVFQKKKRKKLAIAILGAFVQINKTQSWSHPACPHISESEDTEHCSQGRKHIFFPSLSESVPLGGEVYEPNFCLGDKEKKINSTKIYFMWKHSSRFPRHVFLKGCTLQPSDFWPSPETF